VKRSSIFINHNILETPGGGSKLHKTPGPAMVDAKKNDQCYGVVSDGL
jgi:hypothetical protein